MIKDAIHTVAERSDLTEQQAEAVMGEIMDGAATSAQIAAYLMGLRMKGETVEEIAGSVQAMRARATKIRVRDSQVVDTCGTGGDRAHTFNISTTAAFVVAGAGVTVAKHGNRNLSSKSGAADALTEMGLNVMVGPEVVERCISEAGIGFMMAPMHHPATRHVMPVRQELGTRTIFNILGPLTNPAGVKRQLTGAFAPHLIRPMAETLRVLGSVKAWLVHGMDGTDEISIAGLTKVAALEDGAVREFDLHPEEAGLPVHPFEAILGGTPAENAVAFRALLEGAAGAYRDAVLLNAAAALVVADRAGNLKEAVALSSNKDYRYSHLAKVVLAGLQEYQFQQESGANLSREDLLDTVRRSIQRATALTSNDLKKGVSSLATIGATAPFVGLLGTVVGVINAFVKPIAKLLSLPFIVLTLGLFIFVVNAFMLQITEWISDAVGLSFTIDHFFWDAVLAAIVITLVSWVLNIVLPEDDD